GQLSSAEGSLDICEPVVEPDRRDLVVPGAEIGPALDPLVAEPAQTRGQLVGVCGHRAAFAGRDRLDGMKRERTHVGLGAVAHWTVGRSRPESVCRVLDHY